MLLKFIAFTLVALNPFVCNAAFSDELRQQKSPLVQAVLKSNSVDFVCFMKTTSGAVIDLSKLCDRVPVTPPKPKLANSKYNYQKIENFNRTVYGD